MLKPSSFILIVAMALQVVWLASCMNKKEEDVSAYVNDYSAFLDSIETVEKEYTQTEWDTIQHQYEIKRAGVENKRHLMDEKQIQQVEKNNNRYSEFKEDFYKQLGSKAEHSGPQNLYTLLKVTDKDKDLDSVNTTNLVETYRHFVKEVKMNKENYSGQEWKQVDQLWNRLNKRKEMLEDSINVEAVNEINKLRVEYGQYKVYDKANTVSAKDG